MPRSDHMTGATKHELVQQLLVIVVVVGIGVGGAAISVAAAATAEHVDSFSYPAFDATTTRDLVVMARSNDSAVTPATRLFDHDGGGELNRTEGYLLLSRAVNVWRAGRLQASFNTSFALTGGAAAACVSFVVLCILDRDRYPVLGGVTGMLEVTGDVPNGTAPPPPPSVVWIEYDAAAHRVSVYEAAGAGAGQARPAVPVVDKRIGDGPDARLTSGKAMVGFFASSVQDIVVGVRDWNMTVDSSSSGGGDGWKKGTSWWMLALVLLVVLGSVVDTAWD